MFEKTLRWVKDTVICIWYIIIRPSVNAHTAVTGANMNLLLMTEEDGVE